VKHVVVLEDAAGDIGAAVQFYERIEAGLGDYFTQCLFIDLHELEKLHGVHSLHFGFHRMLSNRFPFGIYYREEAERTEVFAVLDLRMEPSWIRDELTSRNP
jgi:hypothetical protein